MPRNIEEGFRDFLRRLTPTPGESDAAKRHRESIRRCIDSNHGLNRFWRTGSFGNGTSISAYSDVDYMASLPSPSATSNSYYTLRKVRNSLDDRFPNTGVRIDCPAIVVPFGTLAKETTEVTPATFLRWNGNFPVYAIPDCNSGWMRASPDAHNDYVSAVDIHLNRKIKPLIRFIKAWKYYNNVPIFSFYLELRVSTYAVSEKSIVYSIDVDRILQRLAGNALQSVRDPMKISGVVYACRTQRQLDEALSRVKRAATRSGNARSEEARGNVRRAFEWWDKVFAGRFPGYYRS